MTNLTLAQFYGALDAYHRAQAQQLKDLMYAIRIAGADTKTYKAAVKQLDT